jgi:CubicO group peptidase (beta-lactamase class C family)
MYASPGNLAIICFLALCIAVPALGRCYDPSPAFPLPKHSSFINSPELFKSLLVAEEAIKFLVDGPEYDISSFSIEVTSSTETLWESHHTAKEKDAERPGAVKVDGNSMYRIASITKSFTTLAILQQHSAGNLSLDDTLDKYLPDLSGHIPWKDITLRMVASQLSGVPRDCEQSIPGSNFFLFLR